MPKTYLNWWGEIPPVGFPEITPLFLLAAFAYRVLSLFGQPIPDWVIDEVSIPFY